MKKIILSIILLSVLSPASGQKTISDQTFDKIVISSNAKVILRQDSACTVRYSGGDKPSDAVSISDGTLRINGMTKNDIDITSAGIKGTSHRRFR